MSPHPLFRHAAFALTALLLALFCTPSNAAPIMTMYKKEGANKEDCRITMGNGSVNFRSSNNACSNDDDYYFSISGAEDGVEFGLYNNPDCKTNESYATYKMGRGDANRNIRMTAVDASRGLSSGALIHDTLRAGADSKSGQLHGKVSCVKVWGMSSNAAMAILPKDGASAHGAASSAAAMPRPAVSPGGAAPMSPASH